MEDIDAAKPPLMLSFINLFLNDAVFMLDEAIEVCVNKCEPRPGFLKIFNHKTPFEEIKKAMALSNRISQKTNLEHA